MTPKEKAIELVNKMNYNISNDELGLREISSKQCAIIVVDEILAEFHMHDYSDYMEHRFQYFKQVKQEIQKL